MSEENTNSKSYTLELLSVHLAKLPGEGTTINIIPNESTIKGGLFSKHFIDFICNEIGGFVHKSIGEYEEQMKKIEASVESPKNES